MTTKYPKIQSGSYQFAVAGKTPYERELLIEYYIDYVCPYSTKIYRTMVELISKLSANKSLPPVKIQMHQLPQPWHMQSMLLHEVALIVRKIYGEKKYFDFSTMLFDNQKSFFDDVVWNKTKVEIYKELCDIAKNIGCDVNEIQKLLQRVEVGHNSGNGITNELTKVVKFHRKRGVHVTPTVFINGIEATEISSSWTITQWLEFLEPYNILV